MEVDMIKKHMAIILVFSSMICNPVYGAYPVEHNTVLTTPSEADTQDTMIRLIEEDVVDEDGNVVIDVTVSESVQLPLTLTLKGSEGIVSFTVLRNDQPIKIKAGTYELLKASDGNSKKLPAGATLTIAENGGPVYLNFDQAEESNEANPILDFFRSNLVLIPILCICGYLFMRYHKA